MQTRGPSSKRGVRGVLATTLLSLLATLGPAPLTAAIQTPQDTNAVDTPRLLPPTAAVVLRGDTLVVFRASLGPFTPTERARAVRDRIRRAARGAAVLGDTAWVAEGLASSDVMVGEDVILTVTDADALADGRTRAELAADIAARVATAIESQSWVSIVRVVLRGALLTILTVAVLWILVRAMGGVFPRIVRLLGFWRTTRIPSIRIQKLEIVSANRITDVLIWLTKATHVVLVIVLLYFFIPLVLSFFPWTQGLADRLLDYVVQPFGAVLRAIVDYIPELFGIVVIVIVVRYLLFLIHFVFRGIEREVISLPGFYPDWAEPTYKIVRFMVLVFALILVLPLLPGAGTEAFGGVSVFVGLLVSLGSAGAIANVVAGIVLTYMRPFRVGDRVRIADTVGDVVEKSLLVTRIRTIKNVDITVPNAMVLGAHIVNYSSSAGDRGVIMHTSVTIGYDAPWRKVHETLVAAAKATPSILDDPEPFVFQTSLGDFAVNYELNAYTAEPNRMAEIYSDLHQSIQDRFNEAGIEIMSPMYTAVRDGNTLTIPEEHRPAGYRPPGFRFLGLDLPGSGKGG